MTICYHYDWTAAFPTAYNETNVSVEPHGVRTRSARAASGLGTVAVSCATHSGANASLGEAAGESAALLAARLADTHGGAHPRPRPR